jgi:hypothetical protein
MQTLLMVLGTFMLLKIALQATFVLLAIASKKCS